MQKNGIILLDKPAGITSFNVLAGIKKKLQTGKVGHAGTLDKFATGLLIVLTGSCTRITPLFLNLDKEYVAGIRFGIETDTLDPEGKIVDKQRVPVFREIERAIPRFIGDVSQIPPDYSAVHVNGKRSYQIKRNGDTPKLNKRKVTIHGLTVLSYDAGELVLNVKCSKGTYIRALARDLGRAAGSCAHVNSLRRIAIGPFSAENAVTPEQFDPVKDVGKPYRFISGLSVIKEAVIKEDQINSIKQGRIIREEFFESISSGEGDYAVFDRHLNLLAIIERMDGSFNYKAVLVES
ncbi:MAG: tRNA pseudouridine(55) synthase TruB [Spirochaetales bacterium]|nr:tRNA pseudouridine(55) synthase TruB [Spirochaetales bacterium]